MDVTEFRQQLERDGYGNIGEVAWEAGAFNDTHTHEFSARGLVLAGAFTVACDAETKTCGVGDTFTMNAGTPHAETAGADGVRFLVGRK